MFQTNYDLPQNELRLLCGYFWMGCGKNILITIHCYFSIHMNNHCKCIFLAKFCENLSEITFFWQYCMYKQVQSYFGLSFLTSSQLQYTKDFLISYNVWIQPSASQGCLKYKLLLSWFKNSPYLSHCEPFNFLTFVSAFVILFNLPNHLLSHI